MRAKKNIRPLWSRSKLRASLIQSAPTFTTCMDRCCYTWGARQKRRRNWKLLCLSTMNTAPPGRSRWTRERCLHPNYCRTRSDTLGTRRPRPKHDRNLPFWQEVRIMKHILKILAIIVGVLIVIAIAIPFFIDANTFRPKLEAELTDALGRQVKVGNLSLSLLSGGVTADNISIADDPQ